MDANELKTADGVKIYVKRARDGEFTGTVYADDLPEELRNRLNLSSATPRDGELEVSGEFEVDIDDPHDQIAYPMLRSITVYGEEGAAVDLDCDASGISSTDIESQIEKLIDWGAFWEDWTASACDDAYENYKDYEADRGDS
jgi:hypothetical protein